jgi:hypothetical protein
VCLYTPIVAKQRLGKNPLPLLGNGSVKIFLSLLGNGSVKYFFFSRQRLGGNVTAVTNTHATIEEVLSSSFLMWLVSYQGK